MKHGSRTGCSLLQSPIGASQSDPSKLPLFPCGKFFGSLKTHSASQLPLFLLPALPLQLLSQSSGDADRPIIDNSSAELARQTNREHHGLSYHRPATRDYR